MKYVKMLGLAAVAATALAAFVGASSASATVLCKTATNPCTSIYTGALEGSLASGTTAVLKSTGGSVEDECTEARFGGEITSDGAGKNVRGPIKSLFFAHCTSPTAVLEETGTLELEGAIVKAKGFTVTVEATSFISCVYTATGTALGTFTGGNPAIVTVNAVVNKKVGPFLCPSDALWELTYRITGIGTLHSEPE